MIVDLKDKSCLSTMRQGLTGCTCLQACNGEVRQDLCYMSGTMQQRRNWEAVAAATGAPLQRVRSPAACEVGVGPGGVPCCNKHMSSKQANLLKMRPRERPSQSQSSTGTSFYCTPNLFQSAKRQVEQATRTSHPATKGRYISSFVLCGRP